MNILALSCSPRPEGNTETLLHEALRGAEQEGAIGELYSVSGKTIAPCDACGACGKTSICRIKDDMQVVYEKMLAADGIIFGTPIYMHSMTSQAKTIIDRTYALNRAPRNLANRVGGIVVTAGSLGIIDALKDFYFFMAMYQMIPANFVGAYARAKGDVTGMERTMKAAFDLGRQVAQIAAKKFQYPTEFRGSHFAYGTHTR